MSSLVTLPEDHHISPRVLAGQSLKTRNVLEQPQHCICEFSAAKVITRLLTNYFNQRFDLIWL